MVSVVVVGGGPAGCAAAVTAAKSGAQVTLLERTDMLLGGGNRAGRMNYNGKLVAAEECKAMGAGDLFEGLESIILHRANIREEQHTYVYNTAIAEPTLRRVVERLGITVRTECLALDVERDDGTIRGVLLKGGERIAADAFVDCSGSSGGMEICNRYGQGCVLCLYKCPAFGDRVSIATRAGAPEIMRIGKDGRAGGVGAALALYKESLAPSLRAELEAAGALTIPLPRELINYDKLYQIGAVRTRAQMESINLVDIGAAAKCVGLGYFNLQDLRRIPGFEMAQAEDPQVSRYNKVGKVSMTPREDSMRVSGFTNLLVAGEKSGPETGIAEVMSVGSLAGHNAVRAALGKELLVLPRDTVVGDFIADTGERVRSGKVNYGCSYGQGAFFQRMVERGLYTSDVELIQRRIADLGLSGRLARLD